MESWSAFGDQYELWKLAVLDGVEVSIGWSETEVVVRILHGKGEPSSRWGIARGYIAATQIKLENRSSKVSPLPLPFFRFFLGPCPITAFGGLL